VHLNFSICFKATELNATVEVRDVILVLRKKMTQENEEVKDKAKRFTMSIIVALLFFLMLLLVFALITQQIVYQKNTLFDDTIFNALSSIISPELTRVMLGFTFFGSRAFLLPAYGFITIFLLITRRSWWGLGITSIALCGAGVLFLFKDIFKRARPLEPLAGTETSFSYPSGHAFSAFTFSSIVVYLIWNAEIKKSWKWIWSIAFFLFASTIAFSRVYLRVHYASDVIAGVCLSLVWLSMCYYTLKKVRIVRRD
jgi:undecaprenyl-diphosphatase